MQVGRRSSHCNVPSPLQTRPPTTHSGEISCFISCKTLNHTTHQSATQASVGGTKGFPKQIAEMQIRHPHQLRPRPRESLAG